MKKNIFNYNHTKFYIRVICVLVYIENKGYGPSKKMDSEKNPFNIRVIITLIGSF